MSQLISIRKPWAAAVLALATLAAGAAFSQAPSAVDAVHARQQHFKVQGKVFKTILDQLHTGTPDPGQIKTAAHALSASAQALPSWFPAGSGPESGVATHAKAEIWTDQAGFAEAARNFQAAAAKLQAAADSGDMAAVGAEAQAIGATCGGCHHKYRQLI
jgi:cytochrome c556